MIHTDRVSHQDPDGAAEESKENAGKEDKVGSSPTESEGDEEEKYGDD